MAPSRRNYAALQETQFEVDQELTAPPAEAEQSQPERPGEIVDLDTQRAAYQEALQEQARAGRIPGRDIGYMLSRFENGEPIARQKAEEAARMREVRQLAEAAAAREEAEQAQEAEQDRDELER